MMNGTVKWFNDEKGYGFISADGGEDVFVHHSGIEMEGYRTLSEGDRVTFEVQTTDRGPRAQAVKKAEG